VRYVSAIAAWPAKTSADRERALSRRSEQCVPEADNVALGSVSRLAAATTSGKGISFRERLRMRRLPTVRASRWAQSVGHYDGHLEFGPAIDREIFRPGDKYRSARRLLQIGPDRFFTKSVFSGGNRLKQAACT